MSSGPHVYGPNRRGIWVAPNANLTDKLKHYLPRLRNAIPNLTDLFFPPSATIAHKDQARQADFFTHMYDVAHGRTPVGFADAAVKRHQDVGFGALELNFEGSAVEQMGLNPYIRQTIARVRSKKPNLPVRINVVPFKGQFLPADLIRADPQLFVVSQTYGGNMEILYAADEVLEDLQVYTQAPEKCSVQHAVMCETGSEVNGDRVRDVVLPVVRDRASFYIDDLLLDAGLL